MAATLGLSSNDSGVIALVTAASQQTRLSGVCEMLRVIAEAAEGYGCILWEVVPDSDAEDAASGRLFVLAAWMKDPTIPVWHYLPMRSVTGQAILSRRTQRVDDVATHPVVQENPNQAFFERTGIQTFCSVPIALHGSSKTAINIYRSERRPFLDSDLARIEPLAALVPSLYSNLRDRVGFNLIRRVSEVLAGAEFWLSPRLEHDFNRLIADAGYSIVAEVATTFDCLETSLFLEDRIDEPGQYRLVATTWREEFKKGVYQKGEGATGWVLAQNRSVRMYDLNRYEEEDPAIQIRYPGLRWSDSLEIVGAARRALLLSPEEPLPPLSYMCAPIATGERVLGAVRCSVTKKGPHYFDDRQVEFLQLVAGHISQWWDNWLNWREAKEENQSWRALVDSVAKMNFFVHNELNKPDPSESQIFREAMRVAGSVIPDAGIIDVRLLEEASRSLYFAETYGAEWDRGGRQDVAKRKERRFPLAGDPPSAGAHVFLTGKAYVVEDTNNDPYYSETFPSTRKVIVAPISSGKKVFGVIDIRRTSDRSFPKHAKQIAELLGQQLGLYYYLAIEIGELNRAKAKIDRSANEQHKMYQNFQHQLRSPIIQAHRTAQEALQGTFSEHAVRPKLNALRGLCRKAERVTRNVGLFADIAGGAPVRLNPKTLRVDEFVKKLTLAAQDHELLVDPNRSVQFHVDGKSFDVLWSLIVQVDHDLLDQAVNNVLDNAGKYSYPKTKVRISGGLIRNGEWFYISFVNQGFRIKPSDIRNLAERGWRSDEARWSTGEGSGIGLWIVEQIMKAHKGELVVIPTSDQGLTDVRLLFPKARIG